VANILIADDDPQIRLLLRLLLRREGHVVSEAADADTALAAIRTRRLSVAILDVAMPGRSGLDICRLIRANRKFVGLGVIIVSASATEEQVKEAGADAFLTKPFSPAQLLSMVGDLVSRAFNSLDERPLRVWRAERLLSMRDLAKAAGVAPSTIYLLEVGRTTPRPSVMRRIASVLGVDARAIAEFACAIEEYGLPPSSALPELDGQAPPGEGPGECHQPS